MNWKEIRWRIKYGLQNFPFPFNTLLCLVPAYAAYRLLYQRDTATTSTEDFSPLRPFIILMGKMAFWFILVLVAVSILSTIISWVHYMWLRHSRNYQLQVNFTTETKNGKKNKLYLNALLQGVRRPILGFVKGRLFYDDRQLTDKFSLLSNKRKENTIWRAAITGRSRMNLPDIKEYQLKGGLIYFEDMLHIFSLAVAQPVSGHFYQQIGRASCRERV